MGLSRQTHLDLSPKSVGLWNQLMGDCSSGRTCRMWFPIHRYHTLGIMYAWLLPQNASKFWKSGKWPNRGCKIEGKIYSTLCIRFLTYIITYKLNSFFSYQIQVTYYFDTPPQFLATQTNRLQMRVESEQIHRRVHTWTPIDATDCIQDFPRLSDEELGNLTMKAC